MNRRVILSALTFFVSAAATVRLATSAEAPLNFIFIVLSLRQGPWKLIQPSKRPKINKNTNTELGNAPGAQLYNVKDDPGETQDLAPQHPEKVQQLGTMLEEIRRQGRSRP